jgi:peptidoglycan-associated lipoprotein
MARFIIPAVLLALSLGCKKHVEVTEDLSSPSFGVPADPSSLAPVMDRMERNFQRVFFEYDSAELNVTSKQALQANATIMLEHPTLGLVIQGHCDERGTTDYNLALGDRRAQAVADYLKASGVAPSRLQTLSLGEELPLLAEQGEQAWSQNRRAEFIIMTGEPGLVRGTAEGR